MSFTLPHRRALAFYGASQENSALPVLSTGEAALLEARPLRLRAADAFRNDPLIHNALSILRRGLLSHPMPVSDDEDATKAFAAWAQNCGYQHNYGSFAKISLMVAHHLVQDGEVFVQRVWTSSRRSRNGLLLAVWPKRLVKRGRGHNWTGHEYEGGMWAGTWFKSRSVEPGWQGYDPVFVPADDLIWCRYVYEGDQVEGLPRVHAGLESSEQLGDYAQTALVQAKVAACTSAVVLAEESIFGPQLELGTRITDNDGNEMQDLHPGSIPIVHGAKDVKGIVPTTSATFPVDKHTARVAAGTGLTYELVSGEMGAASFSSARHAMLVRDEVLDEAAIDYDPFRDGVIDWFVEAELLMGRDWTGAGFEWLHRPTPAIDPVKQATADKIEIELGTKSRKEAIEARGRDPKKVFAEIDAEQERRSERGEDEQDQAQPGDQVAAVRRSAASSAA